MGVGNEIVRNPSSAAIVMTALVLGLLLSTLLGGIGCEHRSSIKEPLQTKVPQTLPKNFSQVLDRFTFINKATNEALKEFRILGGAVGTYVQGGNIFETYVVSFEDRYGGAEADLDFLDVIVEMKRARAGDTMTVRIVQLGLDTIDVYVDGRFLDSIKPAIEVQIGCRSW